MIMKHKFTVLSSPFTVLLSLVRERIKVRVFPLLFLAVLWLTADSSKLNATSLLTVNNDGGASNRTATTAFLSGYKTATNALGGVQTNVFYDGPRDGTNVATSWQRATTNTTHQGTGLVQTNLTFPSGTNWFYRFAVLDKSGQVFAATSVRFPIPSARASTNNNFELGTVVVDTNTGSRSLTMPAGSSIFITGTGTLGTGAGGGTTNLGTILAAGPTSGNAAGLYATNFGKVSSTGAVEVTGYASGGTKALLLGIASDGTTNGIATIGSSLLHQSPTGGLTIWDTGNFDTNTVNAKALAYSQSANSTNGGERVLDLVRDGGSVPTNGLFAAAADSTAILSALCVRASAENVPLVIPGGAKDAYRIKTFSLYCVTNLEVRQAGRLFVEDYEHDNGANGNTRGSLLRFQNCASINWRGTSPGAGLFSMYAMNHWADPTTISNGIVAIATSSPSGAKNSDINFSGLMISNFQFGVEMRDPVYNASLILVNFKDNGNTNSGDGADWAWTGSNLLAWACTANSPGCNFGGENWKPLINPTNALVRYLFDTFIDQSTFIGSSSEGGGVPTSGKNLTIFGCNFITTPRRPPSMDGLNTGVSVGGEEESEISHNHFNLLTNAPNDAIDINSSLSSKVADNTIRTLHNGIYVIGSFPDGLELTGNKITSGGAGILAHNVVNLTISGGSISGLVYATSGPGIGLYDLANTSGPSSTTNLTIALVPVHNFGSRGLQIGTGTTVANLDVRDSDFTANNESVHNYGTVNGYRFRDTRMDTVTGFRTGMTGLAFGDGLSSGTQNVGGIGYPDGSVGTSAIPPTVQGQVTFTNNVKMPVDVVLSNITLSAIASRTVVVVPTNGNILVNLPGLNSAARTAIPSNTFMIIQGGAGSVTISNNNAVLARSYLILPGNAGTASSYTTSNASDWVSVTSTGCWGSANLNGQTNGWLLTVGGPSSLAANLNSNAPVNIAFTNAAAFTTPSRRTQLTIQCGVALVAGSAALIVSNSTDGTAWSNSYTGVTLNEDRTFTPPIYSPGQSLIISTNANGFTITRIGLNGL